MSDDPESYLTLIGPGTSEIKRRGSRFLGFAFPVSTEEQAQQHLSELAAHHYDARHICHGLRVGLGAQRIDRSNDDGEPPRSAGLPIWQVLSTDEVENTLVAVVRYFGGTKLGIGGLQRAYRDAAQAALGDAGVHTHHPESSLVITLPYDRYDEFEYLVNERESLRIAERTFTADVEITLAVWTSQLDATRGLLGGFLGCDPDDL